MRRQNTTSPSVLSVYVNDVKLYEPGVADQNWRTCSINSTGPFFTAIEFPRAFKVSPITLVPRAMPDADIQLYYFDHKDNLAMRPGPAHSVKQMTEAQYPVAKEDYKYSIASIAPLVMHLKRTIKPEDCPYTFSNDWLAGKHQNTKISYCGPPAVCSDEVLNEPSTYLTCPNAETQGENSRYFGIQSSLLLGFWGFTDFLFSFTHSELLTRDEESLYTADFLDSRSTGLIVVIVFYSPPVGITTMMQVRTNAASPPCSLEVALAKRAASSLPTCLHCTCKSVIT